MAHEHSRARDVFLDALDRPAGDRRAAFIVEACGSDQELRHRVMALLQAHEAQGSIHAAEPLSPVTGDFVSANSGDDEFIGTVIGPYKLLQKLGEGGMGVVWMAEQEEPVRRRVAIKLIKAGMDSRQVLARFEAERHALALMDHPNIAKVLDAGTLRGRPYFVMELVKGIPITKYCDQVHLSPSERLKLFIPVCQAVQHAHQKGIIHRDLKPTNVIVGLYDGQPIPKVIDFGVAKAITQRLTEHTMFTEVGQIVGTLEYMAPEQAELNNLDIDTRADIYSLGVILYELLAGTPPFTRKQFEAAAFSEMLRMIREVEPPKPSTKVSSSLELPNIAANRQLEPKRLTRLLHGDLDWIVMKCLEKERARRYETANGLALDVQRFLADEPVLAGPPTRWYRLRKLVRKNRGAVIAAGVLSVALIAGVIGTTWGMIQARRERDQKENALLDALAQKNRANEQAAIAAAVNSFLCQDLLLQADSWAQRDYGFAEDPNLTVRVALGRAADKIDGRFSGQPMVEAAVRQAIGNALRGVGEPIQSIPHLERVAAASTKMRGANHLETLSARYDLARAYEDAGRFPDAIRILEDVNRQRTALLGEDHADTLVARHQLANLFRLTGRPADAVHLGEQVTAQFEKTRGESDYHTLSSKHNLSIAYVNAGRIDDAVRLAEKVLAQRKIHPGPTHLDTLVTMQVVASAYRYAGRFAESVKLHEEVRDLHIQKLGADHPRTLVATNMLSLAYQTAGRIAESVPLLESIRDVQIKKLGIDHPDSLITQHNLAHAYRMTNRLEESIKLFEQVRDARVKAGPEHPDTLVTLNNLAIAYQNAGRLNDSLAMFEKVREVQARTLGADHPDTLITSHNLAMTYRSAGKIADAIRLHEEVRKLQTKRLGEGHPELLITCNNLAMAYLLADRADDAVNLFKQVHASQSAKIGADHPDTLITAHNLGVAHVHLQQLATAIPILEDAFNKSKTRNGVDNANTLVAQNTLSDAYIKNRQFADAERLLRDALDLRVRVLPNHWTTAYTRSLLGESLFGQDKHAEAEPMMLQGLADLKRLAAMIPVPVRTKRLTEAVDRLIRLNESSGKPEEATKWRQELEAIKADKLFNVP